MSNGESAVCSSRENSIQQTAPGRGIGVMFLAFFGTLWLALGCLAQGSRSLPLLALVGAGGVGIFLAGMKLSYRDAAVGSSLSPGEQARRRRVFRNVNLLQWGAVVAWIAVLNVKGHVEWITPGIMFIVGVHFFPLAKLFNNPANAVLGAAFTLLALLYPFLASGGPTSAIGPVCAGLILWTDALAWLAIEARRARAPRLGAGAPLAEGARRR
jgi:hypothetical protein